MSRFWFLMLLTVAVAILHSAELVRAKAPEVRTSPNSEFDDPLEELDPARPRSEEELDRVTASALYAHGRILFHSQDFVGALRQYQRAWRYDPEALPVLREIVPLAYSLKRNAVAFRYAVLAAEKDPRDHVMLRRLAIYLTEQQDFERAARFYETSLQLQDNPTQGAEAALVRLEMGRLYFLTEQFDKSAEAFAHVRDALADPKAFGINDQTKKTLLGEAERTYGLIGESFFQAGRYDEALEMFKAANEAKENKALMSLNEARVAAKKGDIDAAFEQLDEYFATKSSDEGAEPYELLAELLKEKIGDAKQAEQELRKRLAELREQDADNVSLAYYMAGVLKAAEEFDEAAKIYREQLEANPRLDGYQALIEIYHRQDKKGDLLEVLGSAVAKIGSLDPLIDQVEPLTKEASYVDQLLDTARTLKESAGGEFPEGVPLAVGLLAIEADKFDQADEFFELALEDEALQKRQVMQVWGMQLLMADESEKAAAVFQRAIDEKVAADDSPDFHFYLAGASELAGRTDEAVAAAKKAIDIQPDSVRLQGRVPWILYHAKRYEEAEKEYLALLEKHDDDYESEESRQALREARFILSNLCIHQERLDEAEEWLEQVLDEYPENIGALNDLGYLWADQGKHLNRSLRMVRKAVAEEPDNYAYRDSLGWALYHLGRYDEAVEELVNAAQGEDPDGIVLDHLGDAYLKANQREKAVETWKRAAEALKNQEDMKALQKTEKKIERHAESDE